MPGTAVTTRRDIQVLRAVAVGAVVLYHLSPHRFPGGFVGVDVFFVISGFLITGHLLRSATSESGIRLGSFWASRARRLLPLACLVLLVTVPLLWYALPPSMLVPGLTNVIASALYVQNWALAAESVNYLARDQVAMPTQHYWSLSVEEQFYLVWPLLILLGVLASRRISRGRRRFPSDAARAGVLGAVGLVFVVSFAYSLAISWTSPGLAYFATTTRAWEFAAGGLLVAWTHGRPPDPGRHPIRRAIASWAGALLILTSCFVITATTAFPGLAALAPVVGSALFIWGGDGGAIPMPGHLSRLRPVTYLGDISYGIYLWHWPLIVAAQHVGQPGTTYAELAAIVAATLVLSALSTRLVEAPFRFGRFWTTRVWRGFVPGAVGIALVVGLSASAISHDASRSRQQAEWAAQQEEVERAKLLVPTISQRGQDKGDMYACFDFDAKGADPCVYGPADASVRIALIGDSHAAHLIPAVKEAALANGWQLTTITGIGCQSDRTCTGGPDTFRIVTQGHFDLVLYGAFRDSAGAYPLSLDYVSRLVGAGAKVVPIVDIPRHPKQAFDCIDASANQTSLAAQCTTSRAEVMAPEDHSTQLAKTLNLPVIDITDVFCDATTCHSVVGNTIVYQDSPSSHLTATMSRQLGDRLSREISRELGR